MPMEDIRESRVRYFDWLRILAILAVIFIHVSSQCFYTMDVNGYDWTVCNIYNGISRWAVPVLVMISGALFLPRHIPVKKLYSKYILRLAVAFTVWSVVYYLIYGGSTNDIVTGHYHMWFILMIIGLYILTPLLAVIARNEKLLTYFLLIGLAVTIVIPSVSVFISTFGDETAVNTFTLFNWVTNTVNIQFTAGFAFYFMLGYRLATADLSSKLKSAIYILGIAGFVLTVLLNRAAALKSQSATDVFSAYYLLNILMMSIGVFVFFRNRNFGGGKFYSFIQKLSKYSFGAYLVHVLIMDLFASKLGLSITSFNVAVSIPVISLAVFAVSMAVSALLNLIPFLKKYIV